jgi:hypothetical protein
MRRARATLAIVAVTAYLGFSAGGCVFEAARRFSDLSLHAGEDFRSALTRTWGEPFARGIEKARAQIRPDEPYALIEGRLDTNDRFRVRYELAPRPAVYIGRARDLAGAKLPDLDPEIRWAVIATVGDVEPELVPVNRLESRLAAAKPPAAAATR